MHEIAFAHAALPRRAAILKMPLRNYSIAHAVWLHRRGNAFVGGKRFDTSPPAPLPDRGGEGSAEPGGNTSTPKKVEAGSESGAPSRKDVIEAVLICMHSHEELLRLDEDWLLGLKVLVWKWRVLRGATDDDIALAIAEFWNYLAEGSLEPITMEAQSRASTEPQRSPGAPFLLRLIQFLMLKFQLSEEAAWNYPMGLAKWHFAAFWEGENGLRIKNESEAAAEDEIAAVDALVAGGMSFGEAFKKVRNLSREDREGCKQNDGAQRSARPTDGKEDVCQAS